jgi:site-specific DNA-methyltransferase (adenine-specific)
MKQIPDGSVDCVVTDPPYRVISGGNGTADWVRRYGESVLHKNDGKIFNNNDIEIADWIAEIYRVLKNGAHCYIMTNVLNLKDFLIASERAGFKLHNLLVWEKNTATANRWYMKNCEYTLFLRKGLAKTINNPSSKTVHCYNNIVGNKSHPTEKPIGLMELYVSNSTEEHDVVLDPFMGSGTTGIACRNLNRKFIGIELDEEYFKTAENRIKGSLL